MSSTSPSSPRDSYEHSPSSPSSSTSNTETSQGLSIEQIQTSPILDISPFHDSHVLDPIPLCPPSLNKPIQESLLQSPSPSFPNINPFSKIHIPCQEDDVKNTKRSPEINQDQDPNGDQIHPILYQDLISLEPYNDPIILIQCDPFPLNLSLLEQDHDHPSMLPNDLNPTQDYSIPSLPNPSKDPIIPSCPPHDHIIPMDPPTPSPHVIFPLSLQTDHKILSY